VLGNSRARSSPAFAHDFVPGGKGKKRGKGGAVHFADKLLPKRKEKKKKKEREEEKSCRRKKSTCALISNQTALILLLSLIHHSGGKEGKEGRGEKSKG